MSEDHHRSFHILQVVHSLVIGGTERVVCDLTRHFNRGKFRTSVCCLDDLGEFGKDLLQEGIPVRVFNRRPGIDYHLLRDLRDLYRELKIDLVHAHQYTPYFYSAAACLGSSVPKTIFTEHGRHQPDRLRLKRVVFNQILRTTTSGYTAVSDFTRRSLIEFEKMPGSKIQVIYNGVPYHDGRELPNRRVSREKLGIGIEKKVVLSIGRMDPIKDFQTLIKAFMGVIQKIPHALLLIAGGGEVYYLETLHKIVDALGIRDQVKFLGPRRDVQDLLAACDVFALTSISEAASMTILEAMAASRPVVATRTGGNPELVVNSETGYLVPIGDNEAVCEALMKVLNCPDLGEKIGNAGKTRFESMFRLERTYGEYEKLYEEILCR